MKWLVEIVRDGNGDITDRIPMFQTSQRSMPRDGKEYDFLDGDSNLSFPKAEDVGEGVFEIKEDDAKKQFEDDIAVRIKRQSFGSRILAIQGLANEGKSLTDAEVVTMRETFKDIRQALQDGDILAAEALITATTPDEVTVTTADKTFLLAEISTGKAQLGYE